jgi:hypothetical protein
MREDRDGRYADDPASTGASTTLMVLTICAGRRLGAIPAAVAALAVVAGLSGCTDSAASRQSAADVVRSLGAVPIPSASSTVTPSTGNGRRPVLVAMGAPVLLTLPDATVRAVALGPEQDVEYRTGRPVPTSTDGTITLRFAVRRGAVTVRAADLSSRDETGAPVALRPRAHSSVTIRAGGSATLTVVGRYRSGAAQLSWSRRGRPVAIWDFTIELD